MSIFINKLCILLNVFKYCYKSNIIIKCPIDLTSSQEIKYVLMYTDVIYKEKIKSETNYVGRRKHN